MSALDVRSPNCRATSALTARPPVKPEPDLVVVDGPVFGSRFTGGECIACGELIKEGQAIRHATLLDAAMVSGWVHDACTEPM